MSVPYLKDGSKTSLIIIYSFLIRITLNNDAKTKKMEKKKKGAKISLFYMYTIWGGMGKERLQKISIYQ